MKKLLLSLVAVFSFAGAFAYEIGDYIYTSDAKYKVVSESLVPNIQSWNGAQDPEVWSVVAEPDEGITSALESLDGSEGSTLLTTNTATEFGKRYVVTLKIKGIADGSTSTAAGAQNEVNAFLTNDAPSTSGVITGNANVDYFLVSSTQNFLNGEWSEISFAFVDTCTEQTIGSDTHYLNITLGRLTTGTVVADAEVREVEQVYDTRISDRAIAFAQAIMNDPNFSEGADANELSEIIGTYEEMSQYGQTDDIATMEGLISQLNDALQAYMDTNSTDLSENFKSIDIKSLGRYNRGGISNGQVIDDFIFRGNNWLHAWGKNAAGEYDKTLSYDYLNKQIQDKSNSNDAGSVALYNTNIPNGKYYISGEVMNAICDKNYNYTYTFEGSVKLFVGSDSSDVHIIKGKDFEKFYYIGDLKEGETFEAGFWWGGADQGTAFQVKNIEIRGFGNITEKIERNNAWNTFIAQWNAATNARKSVMDKMNDANYPWEQDSLQSAINTWDYLYKAVDGVWIDADGKDTGIATNDELVDWATTQGYEYQEGVDPEWMSKYPLVRAYQYASTYVQEQNQPYIDLKALVVEAQAAVDNPNYASLDADDLKAEISNANTLINSTTTENKSEEFKTQIESLQTALDEFKAQGASFYEQAELAVINPNFQDVSGRSKSSDGYRTQGGKEDSWNGWNYYSPTSSEYWRITNDNSDFAGNGRAAMWRGVSGSPLGSATQDITVTRAGHYTFRCQAYCTIDGQGSGAKDAREIFNQVRHINIQYETQQVWDEELEEYVEEEVEISRDTTYISGIKLIFGSVTNLDVDSVDVWTSGETIPNWTPQWFELNYDKETEGEEVLRFGMDGLKAKEYTGYSKTPNAYGFGSVTVAYGGPSEQYYKDQAEYIETGVEPAVINKSAKPVAIFTLSGAQVNSYVKGINIVKYDDGTVRKIYVTK